MAGNLTDRSADTQPLISVIIPVYNAEEYLGYCLDCIIGNTYRNLEIICVNDGSKDKSLDILKEYAAADQRIRIIDKPNGGTVSARNAGMDMAAGEYISFIDNDDRIHFQYFEIMEHFASLTNADVVVCESDNVYSSNAPIDENKIDVNKLNVESLELKDCSRHEIKTEVWKHLYKKSLVEGIRVDERFSYGEDTAFNFMAFYSRNSLKAVYVHAVLYHWLQRDSSRLHTFNMAKEMLKGSDDYVWLIDNGGILRENRFRVLLEAIKLFLDFRYVVSFRPMDEKNSYKKIISARKRTYLNLLRREKVPNRDRVIYTALLLFPELYRRWRIHIDPTMLDWERIQKEKYGQAAKR